MEEGVSRSKPAGPVLVVNFGAQYTQSIARKVKETQIYSEIMPYSMPADQILAKHPATIILSGGPPSMYVPDTPCFDAAIFDANVPVLGICYNFQVATQALGGVVTATGISEYGHTDLSVSCPETFFVQIPAEQAVWMSHDDTVTTIPNGLQITAGAGETQIAAFGNPERHLYGVQFHPEVRHITQGQRLLERFLYVDAGSEPVWTTGSITNTQAALIREQVGDTQVICGSSDGVDSSVAAALVHRAVGSQLTCTFVDHGLLCKGEKEQIGHDYAAGVGIRVKYMDESARFLTTLKGVTEPEQKHKIIGREFIYSFEAAQRAVIAEAGAAGKEVKFLVRGTFYPDVAESGGRSGTANVEPHHDVGGLPKDLRFGLIEPLHQLFKDKVRALRRELGVPEVIVKHQPLPGPGLGVHIIGEVIKERLGVLREAD